ncbi:hypothetical protein [Thermoleptolyngbya sp. PKUAC-SCTB121]|nr:hypothetical protein [Thermoleptolyngbya sp. PKUAC-SCTB121]
MAGWIAWQAQQTRRRKLDGASSTAQVRRRKHGSTANLDHDLPD